MIGTVSKKFHKVGSDQYLMFDHIYQIFLFQNKVEKMRFLRMLKEQSILLLSVILLSLIVACSNDQALEVNITNTLSESRPDAQIVIKRNSLEKYDMQLTGGFFEITDSLQNTVPYQLDDLDGDGQWDELALMYSLRAESTSTLFLKSVNSNPVPSFEDRAQVWFARLDSAADSYSELKSEVRPDGYERDFTTPFFYQFEGPGWENDKIGFRSYFDERSAIDIWGKQTSGMVLQKVGLGKDDYHSLSDWGMDILHVGNSLGAGAIGAKVEDKLYRLENTGQARFEEITDGPIRAIFDLTYQDWTVGNEDYTIKERISIWAADQGYYNEISLAGSQDSMSLIAGLVTSKLNGEPVFGDMDTRFHYLFSHGLQSENGVNLGMSMITTAENFTDYGSRKFSESSVDSTAFIAFNVTPDHPVRYKFVAGWETGNPEFAERQAFEDLVLTAGRRMQNPVRIQFENR